MSGLSEIQEKQTESGIAANSLFAIYINPFIYLQKYSLEGSFFKLHIQ